MFSSKSQAIKVKELSSNILGGADTSTKYVNEATTVVDLDLKGLPSTTQAEDLKKISGVKHVISAVIDQDSIRNVCTGTGRVKLRLAANEDIESVKLQYLKAGYGVQEHEDNPKKKSNFTQE